MVFTQKHAWLGVAVNLNASSIAFLFNNSSYHLKEQWFLFLPGEHQGEIVRKKRNLCSHQSVFNKVIYWEETYVALNHIWPSLRALSNEEMGVPGHTEAHPPSSVTALSVHPQSYLQHFLQILWVCSKWVKHLADNKGLTSEDKLQPCLFLGFSYWIVSEVPHFGVFHKYISGVEFLICLPGNIQLKTMTYSRGKVSMSWVLQRGEELVFMAIVSMYRTGVISAQFNGTIPILFVMCFYFVTGKKTVHIHPLLSLPSVLVFWRCHLMFKPVIWNTEPQASADCEIKNARDGKTQWEL